MYNRYVQRNMKHEYTYTEGGEGKDGLHILTIVSPEDDVVRLHLTSNLSLSGKDSLFVQFFSDMLERGSRMYTKDAYEEALETLGAQVAIDALDASLHIEMTCRKSVVEDVVSILVATLSRPVFLPKEIEKLKKEYVQHLHEEKDNSRALSYGMFARHIYSENEVGYVPTLAVRTAQLKKITQKTLRDMHTLFVSGVWHLSVCADSSVFSKVVPQLSALHVSTVRAQKTAPVATLLPQKEEFLLVPEKQNIEFFMGNRLPLTLASEDFLAFSFGIDVLGKRGGFAGRLMSTVREKEGLTYSIYAWIQGVTTRRSGHWQIFTFFTPKDAWRGITSTMREVTQLIEKGVSEADVKRFKELLTNQFQLAHESKASTLALYHAAAVGGRSPEDVATYPTRIQKLTKKEINAALATYLKPDAIVITGAGATGTMGDRPVGVASLKKGINVRQ